MIRELQAYMDIDGHVLLALNTRLSSLTTVADLENFVGGAEHLLAAPLRSLVT